MTQRHSVTAVLQAGVAEGVFPGAVLQVRSRGLVVHHEAVGRLSHEIDAPPASTGTIYDLASLTKPLATATALLHLIERRRLDLAQPVEEVVDELRTSPIGKATLEQLLCHAAGMPAWRPYYERLAREAGTDGSPPARDRAVRYVLEWIKAEPLETSPGSNSVYSDLGFMLLGMVVERIEQGSIAEWCRIHLSRPLTLRWLDFIERTRNAEAIFGATAMIAPTEQDPWRGRLLHGEVHDENAWSLGGIAGHAGLFGTADAVARIGQWWLDGWCGREAKMPPSLVRRFTSRVKTVPGSSRALGWDTPSAPSSSGRYFSGESFGHLGFTGTSIWIDPTQELVVALVSNRVCPTRANDKIKAYRPRLHDAVWQEWADRT